MFASDEQPSNAYPPIEVTPSGITTLVNDSQPENAELPIAATLTPFIVSGIRMFVSDPLYPVITAYVSLLILEMP